MAFPLRGRAARRILGAGLQWVVGAGPCRSVARRVSWVDLAIVGGVLSRHAAAVTDTDIYGPWREDRAKDTGLRSLPLQGYASCT